MDMGIQSNSDGCARLCCNSSDCDLAFYAFHRCYLISCHDEYLCQPTPSLLPNFNPAIIEVSRSRSVSPTTSTPPSVDKVLHSIQEKNENHHSERVCNHSSLYTEVTLRKGYEAGNFTSHGQVSSPKECLSYCCQKRNCDLMFMFLNNCFTVSCFSGYACEIVSAKHSRFAPKIMYVVKRNSSEPPSPSQLNSSLLSTTSVTGGRPVNIVYVKENITQRGSESVHRPTNSQAKYGEKHAEKVSLLGSDILANIHAYLSAVNTSGKRKPDLRKDLKYRHLTSKLHRILRELERSKHRGGSKRKHGAANSYVEKEIKNILKQLKEATKENRELQSEVKSLVAERYRRMRERKRSHKQTVRKDSAERFGLVKTASKTTKTGKRVVIVDPDTDNVPVVPTDEHVMEEHRIYGESRRPRHHHKVLITKTVSRRKQLHSTKKVKAKHRKSRPKSTNEHIIQEHEIYEGDRKAQYETKKTQKYWRHRKQHPKNNKQSKGGHRIDNVDEETDEHEIGEHSIERPPNFEETPAAHSKKGGFKKRLKSKEKEYFSPSGDLDYQIAGAEPDYLFGSGEVEEMSSNGGHEERQRENEMARKLPHRRVHKLKKGKGGHKRHKTRRIKHKKNKLDLLFDQINGIYGKVQKLYSSRFRLGSSQSNVARQGERREKISGDGHPSFHKSQLKIPKAGTNIKIKQRKLKKHSKHQSSSTPSSHITPSRSTNDFHKSLPRYDHGSSEDSSTETYKDVLYDYIGNIYHHVQEMRKHKLRRSKKTRKGRKKQSEFSSGQADHEGSTYEVKRERRIKSKLQRKKSEEDIILQEIRKLSKEIKSVSHGKRRSNVKKETQGVGNGENSTLSSKLHKNLSQQSDKNGQRSIIPYQQQDQVGTIQMPGTSPMSASASNGDSGSPVLPAGEHVCKYS